MTSLLILITSKSFFLLNPILMSISILIISLATTVVLFKATMTSWVSFVVILTFSSGMMTLFMYTASLSSNEKASQKKSKYLAIIMVFLISTPNLNVVPKETMKLFSNNNLMMIMGTILIITMMAMSNHGHHPNQTVSTSF